MAWAALVKGSSAYSTKAELNSLALGALQGWPSGLGCWDGWRHGWSAWAVASSGAGAGRRCNAVIFCALPLSSPLSPSLPLQIVGSLGAGGGAGSGVWLGLALHGRRRSRFPGLGRAGASCWPCILSASAGCWLCLSSSGGWLSPGSCWPLLGVECLGAAGCWLWLRLGFPGSRLSAWVQGWRVSRPCRWWWLGWVMGRRWAWWLAYPVRQIAQIKPCRFGYYSREKR